MRSIFLVSCLLLLTGLAEPAADDGTPLRVAELRVIGLGPDSMTREEIQALDVRLLRARGGYVAPRPGEPGRIVRLRDLRGPHGAGTLLYASAVQAILDRVVAAHAERGFGQVGLSVPAPVAEALRVPGADGTLIARFDAPGRALPVPASPAASFADADPGLSDAVLVTARALSIDIAGGAGLREEDLLSVTVALATDAYAIPPGWVAPRPGEPTQQVPLWRLGGSRHEGSVLYGSALQAIVDAVRRAVAARGFPAADVSLAPDAIRRLNTPRSDGLLVLEVRLH